MQLSTSDGYKRTSIQSDVPKPSSQENHASHSSNKSQLGGDNSDAHLSDNKPATGETIGTLCEIKTLVSVAPATPSAVKLKYPASSSHRQTSLQSDVSRPSSQGSCASHSSDKSQPFGNNRSPRLPHGGPATGKIIDTLHGIKPVGETTSSVTRNAFGKPKHPASSNKKTSFQSDVHGTSSHNNFRRHPPDKSQPIDSGVQLHKTIEALHGITLVPDSLDTPALIKKQNAVSIGYKQASGVPKAPTQNNSLPQPAGGSSGAHQPQRCLPAHDEPTTSEIMNRLHGIKPAVGDLGNLSHKELTKEHNLLPPKEHAPETPYTYNRNLAPYLLENADSLILFHDRPIPRLPSFPKRRQSNLFDRHTPPYPSHDNPATREQLLDPSDSVSQDPPPLYSLVKPLPYPIGDNLCPYPPIGRQFPDSHVPQTRRVPCLFYNEPTTGESIIPMVGHTSTPYPLNSSNHAPYPLEEEGSTSAIRSVENITLFHDRPVPYLPAFPKSKTISKPPPYSSIMKPDIAPGETQAPLLLGVSRPTPYRSQFTSGSSVNAPGNNYPYPSVMPQAQRSNPPYPISVPSLDELSIPYPCSSSSTPYPLTIPKPDHLSDALPYLQTTTKPPYSSGFKPSYSFQTYQVPYPLEPKHPHPIDRNVDIEPSTSVNLSSSAFPLFPQTTLPRYGLIGSTSTTSSSELLHAVPFVPVPVPSAPYSPTHSPSAPPIGDDALVHDQAEVRSATPLLEGGDPVVTPPPTYEEAMSLPPITKPLKRR